MLTKWIFATIFIFSAFTYSADNLTEIVGGVDAVKNEFPFQASIRYEGEGHGCGGALIAANWVLTAAHCVRGYEKEQMRVIMGLHDRTQIKDGEKFDIEEIITHPGYGTHDLENDLALIKLKGNSTRAPIPMNTTEINILPANPPRAWVSGWGATVPGNLDLPKILQKVDVPLVPTEVCNQPASYNGSITEGQLCAGYKEGKKDSCKCDSGGPLFLVTPQNTFSLIGIVSFGEGCAMPDKYGVYTKVSYFYPWILQEISK